MWEPEGGSQRLGRRGGQSRRVTLQFGHSPPKQERGMVSFWKPLELPTGGAGAPVWRWAGRGSFLWKVPLLRKKHQKRREVDGFGTCLASTKWTCGETAGGRDGSGARRTLRFLAELEALHPRRERNTVSAQILRRNHKSPPKVLSPVIWKIKY